MSPFRTHQAARRTGRGRGRGRGRPLAFTFTLVLASGAGAPLEAQLRAGAALVDITPSLGTEINGGTRPVEATYVHDPLHVRALVLESAGVELAFAVADTCILTRETCDAAKRSIAEHVGIAPDRVSVSATHTHSAGSAAAGHLAEADPAYTAWLPGRISDAVRVARANLVPAKLGWGSGAVPQHVFCRRILVLPGVEYTNLLGRKGDRVKMNWSSPEPGVDGDPGAPVDPELFVLDVRHEDGRPLAILANYSLHYVGGVGAGHISADYFGVFARRIAQLLGAGSEEPGFVGILSNGTSGDINNIDHRHARKAQQPYEQIRIVAEDVAREALRVIGGIEHTADVTLGAVAREVAVRHRRPGPEDVEAARRIVAGRPRLELRTWEEIYAREQLILAELPESASIPLQVFRVGGVAIAQWPGEIFASSGLELKARSPIRPLFNIGLANGWFGYIPPPEQHVLGGYETWRGRTSPLETGAIPLLDAAFLEMLEELR